MADGMGPGIGWAGGAALPGDAIHSFTRHGDMAGAWASAAAAT